MLFCTSYLCEHYTPSISKSLIAADTAIMIPARTTQRCDGLHRLHIEGGSLLAEGVRDSYHRIPVQQLWVTAVHLILSVGSYQCVLTFLLIHL